MDEWIYWARHSRWLALGNRLLLKIKITNHFMADIKKEEGRRSLFPTLVILHLINYIHNYVFIIMFKFALVFVWNNVRLQRERKWCLWGLYPVSITSFKCLWLKLDFSLRFGTVHWVLYSSFNKIKIQINSLKD